MIRINKLLKVLLVAFIFLGFLTPIKISAVDATKTDPIAKFHVEKKSNRSWYYEYGMPYIRVDGKISYCLEPDIKILAGKGYKKTNKWDYLSEAKKNKLFLFANYGYEYPGHQSRNYYLATQLLIWDVLGWETTWYTTGGIKIKVTKEVNEIKRLAKLHFITPSFDKTNLFLEVGDEITLKDSNGVLEEYIVNPVPGLTITTSGNSITIRVNEYISDVEITGKRKSGILNGSPIIYDKPYSQELLTINDPLPGRFALGITIGNPTTIIKEDVLEQLVEGAVFLIGKESDLSDGVEYYTDAAGRISIDLDPGTYYIQEISVPPLYVLDSTIYEFKVLEEVLKHLEPNTKYLIGNESDLSDGVEYTSDVNGIIWDKFTPGIWYIQEVIIPVEPDPLDPDPQEPEPALIREFEIASSKNITFVNDIRPVTLQLLKVDDENEKPLPGAVFELYCIDDSDNPVLVATETTDEEGIAAFKNLAYFSNYKAVEVQLPEGYDYINDIDEWLFRPADVEFQPVFTLQAENRIRTIALKLIKQSDDDIPLFLNGALFSVEELDENDRAINDLGRMMTGAVYVEGTPGKEFSVVSETIWEEYSALIQDDDDAIDNRLLLVPDVHKLTIGEKGAAYKFLPDDTYLVFDPETYVATTTHIETGTLTFPSVKYGYKYRVCELKAPEGYDRGANYCQVITPKAEYGIDVYENFRVNSFMKKDVPTGDLDISPVVWLLMGSGTVLALVLFFERKYAKKRLK